MSLQDMPMLMAVSCLSPVSTQTCSVASSALAHETNAIRSCAGSHTLIPAIWSVWIVSGTPSWSLSSMAVAPRRNMSRSMSSAALSNASPRPSPVRARHLGLGFCAYTRARRARLHSTGCFNLCYKTAATVCLGYTRTRYVRQRHCINEGRSEGIHRGGHFGRARRGRAGEERLVHPGDLPAIVAHWSQ